MKKRLIALLLSLLMFTLVAAAGAQEEEQKLTTSFYGQLWFNTYYDISDKKASNTGYEDKDLTFAYDEAFTRFGANFYYGKFTGNVEVRPMSSSILRQWGGEYDFGDYKVFIGRAYTPLFKREDFMGRNDQTLAAWMGTVPYMRRDMIQLTMSAGPGTFKAAAIKPSVNRVIDETETVTETDVLMPKMEMSYDMLIGPSEIYLMGGYQRTSEVIMTTNASYDIESYYLGAFVSNTLGGVTVNTSAFLHKNGQQYGAEDNVALLSAVYNPATDSIVDAKGYGYHLAASYKINDMYSIQGGYGYNKGEVANTTAGLPDNEEENSMYYINMPVRFGKRLSLTITPEVCLLDNKNSRVGDTLTDQGDKMYYGATMVIRF